MQTHWFLASLLASTAALAPASPPSPSAPALRAPRGTALVATSALALRAPDGFEARRAAAVGRLLAGLQSYAEWCSSKKLWIERNRALETILVFEPGNLSAKRGLGWQQVADGVWEPPKDAKPVKNFDPAAAKEAPARFAEAVRPWREQVIELLETHRAELTDVQRESVFAELLALDPDDAWVREQRGEARSEKGWVLVETVRAKERRAEIRALVQAALEAVPPVADIEPKDADRAFQVAWKLGVGTERVRVLTTGERDEAVRVAEVMHATRDVFNRVLGAAGDLGPDFTIYLLCDLAARDLFVANLPNVEPAQRAFYTQVEGTGLIGSAGAAWWAPTVERRLDGVTRHAIGAMLQREFDLSVDIAWAWEGIGLYLTRELIGTRLTWFIVPQEERATVAAAKPAATWTKKLTTPGTNWMNEGYRLVRAGEIAGLSATLTRPLNRMTPQDLFVSYVVAAYLLEAEALQLPDLLRAAAAGKRHGSRFQDAWQGALAMDMGALHARLVRWLGERR